VVLKMVAFLDRPEREDDLTDIAQVLERYLGPTDERRFTLPTDYHNACAFAVGSDIGAIVSEHERRVVEEFVSRAKDEDDRHRAHVLLVRSGPWLWRERPETVRERLTAFEQGLRQSPGS
jgi:predicted nucleotidyltransferase